MNHSLISLQVQSVLYHTEPENVKRSLQSIAEAANYALTHKTFTKVSVCYGDCSSIPVFTDVEIDELSERYRGILELQYIFWGENHGTAKGHNLLAKQCHSDYILVQNPDIVTAYDAICLLFEPFRMSKSAVGMSEARQMPIEHPKYYDSETGETSWSSTACTMFPKKVFDEVGGFDEGTFFLYCDDVDFSWMVRLKGYKIIYQPAAVVFHDKSLSQSAEWEPTSAEKYFSAEAGLLLPYKWSRKDLTDKILSFFKKSSEPHFLKAAAEFERRKAEGRLPKQVDKLHKVSEFIDGNYGKMRFTL
ncbi:hypothetical protein [Gorillibacterium sp. CAU 1737]|uniref:hypothetical protein n=1 Tax=Gorillibacterium sp. CAU 1737 TaxID=3140362 RepID=UPI003260BBEB